MNIPEQFAHGVWQRVVDILLERKEFTDSIIRWISAESISAMVEADRIKSDEIAQLREFAEADDKTVENLTALLGKRHEEIDRLRKEIVELKADKFSVEDADEGEEILNEICTLNESEQYIRLFGCYWRTSATWTRDSIPHRIELEMVGPPRLASKLSGVRKNLRRLADNAFI